MKLNIFSIYARGFNTKRWYNWYKRANSSSNKIWKSICILQYMRIASKNGGYVGRETVFKDCPVLPHGFHGIHISREATIGKNVTIYQNVTIGDSKNSAPVIGNNVVIYANAVVIGGVYVGDNAKIAAGAIVVEDVPPFATVASPKACVIRC